MSLALLLFTSACGQSNKTKESSSVEEQSKVAAPEIDINAAVLTNNIEAVKQHIEAGTDINTKDPMSGSTPLITAASFGKTKIAKILIDAKADMSSKNNDGATALHSAAFFCRVEIVQLLIDANADTTAKNNFGATPRESVLGAYSDMKPIYEMLQQQLAPMGMEIDLNEIEKTRPVIAMMLQ
ncbi:ankyrin repeat domain-containing protein [Maribacter sp. HTCC2170]|uniref:ankyrin repeat domain-containing protein n=1 Tax=Maribacter sp. (strain HTCC2170 / KCCM 42371) TaxID=313603 RepID=UPI00006BD334|nr:ankyrin repeat domain-containing protein [Maribacter sp. HTCC2170]EAR02913.1 Ankyrin repeat-containing protein [Maribacter sp. HTCC2170]